MTFLKSHPHLNVLNEERFSGQRLRIIHNIALNLFFLNCTHTEACKREIKNLVVNLEGGAKCNGCHTVYVDNELNPVLRLETINHDLNDPFLVRWIAAWLGVEQWYVTVTVEK